MKIYLILYQDYSDFQVYGVASNREKAQEVIDLIYPDGEIEEYEVDQFEEDGLINLIKSGKKCFQADLYRWDQLGIRLREAQPENESSWLQKHNDPSYDCVHTVIWAKDEEHAKKIAQDRRAQWLGEEMYFQK